MSGAGEAAEQALAVFTEYLHRPGELQTAALQDIGELLDALLPRLADNPPDDAKLHQILSALVSRFEQLTSRAQSFMRGLQSTLELHGIGIEAFLAYKEKLIDYLEKFIGELVVATSRISEALLLLETCGIDLAFTAAARRDLTDVLDPAPDALEVATQRWQQSWAGLRRWFIPGETPSQAELLRARARSAIPALLTAVSQINDRRTSRADRAADFVLERGDRQFTLARLAENIELALAAEPAFAHSGFLWSLDQQSGRRDFVHTLRLLVSLGVLRRIQGDEEQLLRDRQSDALYNVSRPVLSLLLATRRSPSLVTSTDFESRIEALLDASRPDTPEARNRALRTSLTNRLLDDPVLYYETLDEESRAYLDRQRPFLLGELTEATGLHAEVRAEGLALVDLDGDCTDSGLPEEGTEGHLTILLATWLADRLRDGDMASLTIETVRQKTARFIRQHKHHWKQEARQRGAEIPLSELVLTRLAGLSLIVRTGHTLRPLPALGRFALVPSAALAAADETSDLSLES